jgi:hypothetical protein
MEYHPMQWTLPLPHALIAALATTGAALAETATETWRLGGLKSPESVIADAANGRLIVGNMGVFGPDGGTDGFLSVVSMDGKLVTESFTTGLIDPKGMAIIGESLFVVDANGLVEVSLKDGTIIATHVLNGAMFLNDATTDGKAVYVSDLAGQTVFRVEAGVSEVLLRDDSLTLPNGLFYINGSLLVGSMGVGLKPDFTVDTKGGIQVMDIGVKSVNQFAGAFGDYMVDGVAMVGDLIVFDDNPSGVIYTYSNDAVSKLTTLAPGAADLFAQGDMVYVPLTQTGELVALKVSP